METNKRSAAYEALLGIYPKDTADRLWNKHYKDRASKFSEGAAAYANSAWTDKSPAAFFHGGAQLGAMSVAIELELLSKKVEELAEKGKDATELLSLLMENRGVQDAVNKIEGKEWDKIQAILSKNYSKVPPQVDKAIKALEDLANALSH